MSARGNARGARGPRRVLVTDAQERAAVAVIRCLGDFGYAVTATAPTFSAPGFWSRRCDARVRLPDPRRDLAGYLDGLEHCLAEGEIDLLIPATDASLYAVSRHRARFESLVRWTLPDHTTVERCLSKLALHEAAEEAGLAAPQAVACDSREEALEAAVAFGFPVVVKPVNVVFEEDGRIVRCASRRAADAAGLVAALTGRPPWLVQPQLQGTVVSVAGVAVDGGLLAPFGSRYRRLWPPESGDGTFIEPFQVAPALRGGIEQLVRLLGWRGVFQVELLEVDDRLSVLDFNPRAYGSMGLAQGVRAHLAALWVAWCLEERLPPVTLDLGARYRWMESELRHALWQLRQGRWRPAAAVARPHARTSHAFFRRDDPLPAVAQTLRLLRQAAARAGGDLPPTAAAEPALEPAQR